MKKLISMMALVLAMLGGQLMAADNSTPSDDNTTAGNGTSTNGQKPDAGPSKADFERWELEQKRAATWIENRKLAEKYSALDEEDDDQKKAKDAGFGIDPYINYGNTSWMIVATALVLFMTIPGLSLFYGGLARRKNALSILVQCFAITCLMTLLWTFYGYSLAYSGDGLFFGDFKKAFLSGVGVGTVDGSIPESVYFTFQMTFAIITPALIVGAFAERMKFSAVLVFMAIWFTISYVPVWHMVWGGGYLSETWGAVDFAGGTVVHINAGVAGLVACIMLGKRKGFGSEAMKPHNVPLVVIGAAMLWVGWFGFNAGSQLAADGTAGMAQLVTQVTTATAAFTWMLVEWAVKGKPTAVGLATGAVAGLVAITPACGTVGPMGAIGIGVAAGVICYWGSTSLKSALGYDDSFDVFGVHGIGGIVGALLTGLFFIHADGTEYIDNKISGQAVSVIVTIIWSAVAAAVAFGIANILCGGCRSEEDNEIEGLDVTEHGEDGYSL